MESVGVILLGFGEPERAETVEVEDFLERIFLANAALEPEAEGGAESRARALAVARAPALEEAYRKIGGSPLMRQLRNQASALQRTLADRGRAMPVTIGTQFSSPSIADAVAWAHDKNLRRIVALPTYPNCGPSTTLAAQEALQREVDGQGGFEDVVRLTGWHAHPGFARLWASAVERYAADSGVSLTGDDTLLYFSAHGTPLAYLERVPYTRYVEEACAAVAEALGVADYVLGYQTHGNRPIPWVEPANDVLMLSLEVSEVVVVPISFLHEQSETLVELDLELAELARSRGVEFHRVPVPHDDQALIGLLADLVEEALNEAAGPFLRPCSCLGGDAWCTSEPRKDRRES